MNSNLVHETKPVLENGTRTRRSSCKMTDGPLFAMLQDVIFTTKMQTFFFCTAQLRKEFFGFSRFLCHFDR